MKFVLEQTELLVDEIPGAETRLIPGAAYGATLERPEAFDALVLPFLADHR